MSTKLCDSGDDGDAILSAASAASASARSCSRRVIRFSRPASRLLLLGLLTGTGDPLPSSLVGPSRVIPNGPDVGATVRTRHAAVGACCAALAARVPGLVGPARGASERRLVARGKVSSDLAVVSSVCVARVGIAVEEDRESSWSNTPVSLLDDAARWMGPATAPHPSGLGVGVAAVRMGVRMLPRAGDGADEAEDGVATVEDAEDNWYCAR